MDGLTADGLTPDGLTPDELTRIRSTTDGLTTGINKGRGDNGWIDNGQI